MTNHNLYFCFVLLQGAILTTMLATRNFSSKYDAHGKYFTGPVVCAQDYTLPVSRNPVFLTSLKTKQKYI